MLNVEKFKREILAVKNKGDDFAIDKDNQIRSCEDLKCENCIFDNGVMCSYSRTEWLLSEYKESTKVTRLEYELLKYWSSEGYKYIARDRDNTLFIYKDKPSKLAEYWANLYHYSLDDNFRNLFEFVEWEDKEPTSIQEVLGSREVIEDDL